MELDFHRQRHRERERERGARTTCENRDSNSTASSRERLLFAQYYGGERDNQRPPKTFVMYSVGYGKMFLPGYILRMGKVEEGNGRDRETERELFTDTQMHQLAATNRVRLQERERNSMQHQAGKQQQQQREIWGRSRSCSS
jgi:hypothetical protein